MKTPRMFPMNRKAKAPLLERHAGKSPCCVVVRIPRAYQSRQSRLELLGDLVAQVDGLFSSVRTKVLALDHPEIVPIRIEGNKIDRFRGAAERLGALSMKGRLIPLDRFPIRGEGVNKFSLPKFRDQDPRRQDTGRTGSTPRQEGLAFRCRPVRPTARP